MTPLDRDALAGKAAQSQGRWDHEGTERLLSLAHAATANSEWTRQDALRRCPSAEAAEVVYYGAGVSQSADFEVEPPGPFIFCAARHAEYKGLDLLVLAFAEAAAARPELHLVICGEDLSDGGLSRFAAALGLSGRVHCLGRRSNDEVLAWMRRCLFFVLPSRRESLGGAAIEALQAGKAVVAARVGGLPEVVRDGVDGLLVEPKSVPALAGAMRRLLDDPELARRMGEAGNAGCGKFRWDAAIAKFIGLYRSHPSAAGSSLRPSALVIWDRVTDATALAYAENAARAFSSERWPAVLCLRRAGRSESFRRELYGARLYLLGLPGKFPRWLDFFLVLAQLAWISKMEGIRVWHFLLLRYKDLACLRAFCALAGQRPVITLS